MPSKYFVETAENASAALKLDYCSVDLFDIDRPVVNEVNSNAYFKDAERLGKTDIARRYAEYVREAVGL